MEYEVVLARTTHKLKEQVNAKNKEGYKVAGGVAFTHIPFNGCYFAQALVKEEEQKNE